MAVAERLLDSRAVAEPIPLGEMAAQLGVSKRTMWTLVNDLKLSKYRLPGGGKTTYLDPDEVRRKRQPRLPKPVEEG